MLVEIVATGEKVHVKDSEAIQLLIRAGQIQPVVKKQWVPPLTPAHWSVQEEVSSGYYFIAWNCPTCRQGGRAVGTKIDKVHLLRAYHCGHPGGEPVPAPVAARYAVINKPATVLFHPGVQPKRQLATDDNGRVLEAACAREERERAGLNDVRACDIQAEYSAAFAKYEMALKEEQERQDQLNKNGRE
jgi:hypothetical protein